MNTLQAIIFDLDDTLFPVSSLPPAVMAPVFEAVRRANAGPDAIPVDRLERAIAATTHLPFSVIAADHALPPSTIRAWDTACRGLKSPDVLQPFDDVRPVLSGLGQRRFLVTTGYTAFQLGKLAALGLNPLFDQIYVDAVERLGGAEGKPAVFRRLLADWKLKPSAALVVGDSERAEIAAGRALGIPTVQVLRPGVAPSSLADWRIQTLYELGEIIARVEAVPTDPRAPK